MSFISGFTELFKGKKEDAPIAPPTQTLEQKQQELDNLQKIMNSPEGKDFRSPQTDAQDANRITELQGQIEAMRPQETVPSQAIPPEQPQQIPVAEEPKAA